MKVLITTDWYLPAVNGVVTSVVNLQKNLQNAGVDVRVLTLSDTGTDYKEGSVTYLSSVNASRIYPGARAHLKFSGGPVRELINWHPDIVHSQCEFSTFHAARKIARACGCPQVHTYHTLYEDFVHYVSPIKPLGRQGARILTACVCRKVQRVIVPSEKTEDLLKRYHVKTPVTCIPTGIETEKFSGSISDEREKMRKRFGISQEDIVLVSAGRIAAEKKPDRLLSMFSQAKVPGTKLVFVGDGPYRKKLEQLTAELNLTGRVIFTGMVPQQEIAGYYQMGDIFASASESETQGLTYYEAMASGLPLLCLNDPCLKNVLISGKTGFAYNDAYEFAKYLRMLASSAALRENSGSKAKEIVRTYYSAEDFAEEVLNVYRQVLGTYQPQGRRKVYGAVS